jgi:predicted nucleic acid-binding protein
MHTFDTNAVIYYLKDDANVVSLVRDIFRNNAAIYVSTITEIELFGFPDIDSGEVRQIELLLNTVAVIAVDSRIARLAGFLRRRYRINLADSIIAATALFTGTTLVTRNTRDFQKIDGLLLWKI